MSNNPNQQPGDFVHKLPDTGSLGGKTLSELDENAIEAYFTVKELKKLKEDYAIAINCVVGPNSQYYRPKFFDAIRSIDNIITERLRLVEEKVESTPAKTIADAIEEAEDIIDAHLGYIKSEVKKPEEIEDYITNDYEDESEDDLDEDDDITEEWLLSDVLIEYETYKACQHMPGKFGNLEWVLDDDLLLYLNGQKLYYQDMGKSNFIMLLNSLQIDYKTKEK